MTPRALAYILGIDPKTMRHWLRTEYPEQAPGKGHLWSVDDRMAKVMLRRRLASRRLGPI